MNRKLHYLLWFAFPTIILLAGCGPNEDFTPGKYGTIHEGQTWTLDLRPDGSWTGTFSGELLTSGTYAVDGNQLTWLTDSHCTETGNPGTATYRLDLRQDTLRFSLVGRDPCQSRRVILEDEVYQPQN